MITLDIDRKGLEQIQKAMTDRQVDLRTKRRINNVLLSWGDAYGSKYDALKKELAETTNNLIDTESALLVINAELGIKVEAE